MDLHLLTSWADRPARSRRLATIGLFLALVANGALDAATGSDLSLGVFYVLLVILVTVVAGAAAGIAAAAVTAVLWGAADVITAPAGLSIWIDLWNLLTRFAVHAVVVLLVANLLQALHRARDSDALSRSFLATAAHQLRTPIAALSASVEALLVEGSTPAQEQLLANLAGEASRLGRLAAALLRTARLDQGEPTQPRPVDLRELATRELERTRQLCGAECRLSADPVLPPLVLLDAEATAETISNLLDNARRHAASFIELQLYESNGRLLVEVSDDGPGLPTGSEARAFERFVTLDGRGGSGLGLPIARELTQRQGGTLTYVKKAFVLDLPLHVQAGPVAGPSMARSRGGA